MTSIYLDYAAATPVDERVLQAMQPFWREHFYNPSSSYVAARRVKTAIEDARVRVAHWLGARPAEIIFTAGATESINLAIHGVMQRYAGKTVLAGSIEHAAVLEAASPYPHQLLRVDQRGSIELEFLRQAIDDDTVLVSIGYANNEVGTVQPMRKIAEVISEVRAVRRKNGSNLPLLLHTDASQAGCSLDLHADRLGVDLMTLNGGKMYGPKQTGVLYVKAGVELTPVMLGGGQESGLRSGTENVPGIIGFAAALDLAQQNRREEGARLQLLRNELQRRLLIALPQTVVNGNQKTRLPGSLHVSWPGVDGERLLMMLDEKGVLAATGSACAANKRTGSHVLAAMQLSSEIRDGSLRLSLGANTTQEQIEQAAEIIISCIKKLQ